MTVYLGITTASLPATPLRAALCLYCTGTNAVGSIQVRKSAHFDESTITWNTKPSSVAIRTVSAPSSVGFYEVSILDNNDDYMPWVALTPYTILSGTSASFMQTEGPAGGGSAPTQMPFIKVVCSV